MLQKLRAKVTDAASHMRKSSATIRNNPQQLKVTTDGAHIVDNGMMSAEGEASETSEVIDLLTAAASAGDVDSTPPVSGSRQYDALNQTQT